MEDNIESNHLMVKSTSNLELLNPTNDELNQNNIVPSVLRVSWDNIVKRFENEFARTFAKSKKAHFDCLPKEFKVVDGARVRWFPLLLLDAMIFILHNNFFRFATRRAFNQLEILYGCILEEIQSVDIKFYDDLKRLSFQEVLAWPVQNSPVIYDDMSKEEQEIVLSREEDNNLQVSFDCARKFANLELEPIGFPWNSIDALKNHVIQDPPSKSKQKFLIIIDYLSRHHSFAHPEYSFHEIVRAVVCKVLAYFGSNRNELVPVMLDNKANSTRRAVTPTEFGIQNSTSNDSVKLSPTNNNTTVIARQQTKRKKHMHRQRKAKTKRGNGFVDRSQIVYSTYPSPNSLNKARIRYPVDKMKLLAPSSGQYPSSSVEGNGEEYMINPFLFEEQEMSRQEYQQQLLNQSGDSFNPRRPPMDKPAAVPRAPYSLSSSHGSTDYPLGSTSDSWDAIMNSSSTHNYFNISGDSMELNKMALSSSRSWSADQLGPGDANLRQAKMSSVMKNSSSSSSNVNNESNLESSQNFSSTKDSGMDDSKQESERAMEIGEQKMDDSRSAASPAKFPQLNVRIDKYEQSSRWNQQGDKGQQMEAFGNRGYFPAYPYGYPGSVYHVNAVTPSDYQQISAVKKGDPSMQFHPPLPPLHPSSSTSPHNASSPAHMMMANGLPYYYAPPHLPPPMPEYTSAEMRPNPYRMVHVLSPQHHSQMMCAPQGSVHSSPMHRESNVTRTVSSSPTVKGMGEGNKISSASPYCAPPSPTPVHYQQSQPTNNAKAFEQSI